MVDLLIRLIYNLFIGWGGWLPSHKKEQKMKTQNLTRLLAIARGDHRDMREIRTHTRSRGVKDIRVSADLLITGYSIKSRCRVTLGYANPSKEQR